jgi:hypothetical protein
MPPLVVISSLHGHVAGGRLHMPTSTSDSHERILPSCPGNTISLVTRPDASTYPSPSCNIFEAPLLFRNSISFSCLQKSHRIYKRSRKCVLYIKHKTRISIRLLAANWRTFLWKLLTSALRFWCWTLQDEDKFIDTDIQIIILNWIQELKPEILVIHQCIQLDVPACPWQ